MTENLADRFWSKVNFTDHCWEWTASTTKKGGYGKINIGYKVRRAHKVVFEMLYGPVPVGMQVMHSCDNVKCVRPDHLILGTPAENSKDMVKKGRQAKVDSLPNRKGEANAAAKLNLVLVEEVKRRRANGEKVAVLAKELKVAETTIYAILKGKTWTNS